MAFPEGSNPVFRDPASSTHNCNNCNNFIRRYGNIVSIDEKGGLVTMWGAQGIPEPHSEVASQLDALIKSRKIENVFFETFDELNTKLNYEKCNKRQEVFRLGVASVIKRYTKEEAEKFGVVHEDETRVFNHLNVDLPKAFVNSTGASVESILGNYRDKYSVFKRAMEEISLEVLTLVKDLISQGSLLDGTAHLHSINEMIPYKTQFSELKGNKDNWLWNISYALDERTAKFRNTLIGTLCSELAAGDDLNVVCQNWNKRVDPANYMKASAPITKGQIEEAQKFVTENGYLESFDRRLATPDDINVNDIKHIATASKIKPVTIFDNVKSTATPNREIKFDKVEEIPIDKFMEEILPTCTSVEAFVQNKHEQNFVVLTTTKSESSKPIFKWPNNYSWDFNGNLAGKSHIKEAVKLKGGRVDGVLRFSIMWAEDDPSDDSDLDAWCLQPNGMKIGFSQKICPTTSGSLDVDIMHPNVMRNKNIVENITWSDIKKMPEGVYKFWVNPYSARGSKGFQAEIEFNGIIHSYEFKTPVKMDVHVAEVTLKGGAFEVKHLLASSLSPETPKQIWGIETNSFQKVNLVCLSPNHWGEQAVGNKHYFFMLEDAKTDKDVRGFHNENLAPELLKHRKVLEVLGANNKIAPTAKQLAGLGFNATVKDELILKLTGSFNRVIKVRF